MCGINLIIDKQKSLNSDPIKKMSEILQHRGPDETKTHIIDGDNRRFFMASNRLKITDQTPAASQPFTVHDSNCVLLFNGEIYNYHEIKNQLINQQIQFYSNSDTEVLFHWIKKNGEEGINQLEGMFALVFIDPEENKVIISRDQFGIKTLYYYNDEHYFIASSEVNSIIHSGLVKKELNENQIHHYLNYKYADCPNTFYKNIYEIEPGYILTITQEKVTNKSFYSDQNLEPELKFNLKTVEEFLTNSLIKQLEAQVPLGLLLSGGIDSTLLLALAQKEGFTLPTFSIINSKSVQSFGTKDFFYSRLAASTFNSDHHEVEIDISLLDNFEDFVYNIDQPIGDSSYLMTTEICKNASKYHSTGQAGMKILLSGAGADEIFAGYNRHYAYFTYLNNQKALKAFMPLLVPLITKLPAGFPHPLRKKFQLAKKWANSYDSSPIKTYLNYLSFDDDTSKSFSTLKDQDLLKWALNHDQKNYLVNDILALSDKASMQHGIELRVPYLNEKLVNYLDAFPSEIRIRKGQKWMLKSILSKYGGAKFVNRAKEGFGLPLSNWLFNNRVNHLWERIENNKSILFDFMESEYLKEVIKKQKNKSEDHGPYLWSVLVLEHWLNHHFA